MIVRLGVWDDGVTHPPVMQRRTVACQACEKRSQIHDIGLLTSLFGRAADSVSFLDALGITNSAIQRSEQAYPSRMLQEMEMCEHAQQPLVNWPRQPINFRPQSGCARELLRGRLRVCGSNPQAVDSFKCRLRDQHIRVQCCGEGFGKGELMPSVRPESLLKEIQQEAHEAPWDGLGVNAELRHLSLARTNVRCRHALDDSPAKARELNCVVRRFAPHFAQQVLPSARAQMRAMAPIRIWGCLATAPHCLFEPS